LADQRSPYDFLRAANWFAAFGWETAILFATTCLEFQQGSFFDHISEAANWFAAFGWETAILFATTCLEFQLGKIVLKFLMRLFSASAQLQAKVVIASESYQEALQNPKVCAALSSA
jgi:hypothetical protein